MSENQKKVWITGASSGIGKALAEKFASEGWKVAASARRKEILDEMSSHENIFSYPLDVTNQDQIKISFEKIIEDFYVVTTSKSVINETISCIKINCQRFCEIKCNSIIPIK